APPEATAPAAPTAPAAAQPLPGEDDGAPWEELQEQHRELPREELRQEFQPANEVERELLRAAANNDHDLFLQTMAGAEVLLPIPEEMDYTLRPGRPGFPWQTREADGGTVVPVFTSPERLIEAARAAGGGTEYIKLPFTVVLRYWPDHEWLLAINSGSPAGGTILAQQLPGLARWADQRAAQRMTDGFEPQNDVEQRLLDAARRRDTDTFFKVLLGAQVLVPADPETPWGIAPDDADFPWRPVNVHGQVSIQLFTSLKWMNEAIGSSRFVMPSLLEMVSAWPDVTWTLVLNPGTPIDATMPGEQVRALSGPPRNVPAEPTPADAPRPPAHAASPAPEIPSEADVSPAAATPTPPATPDVPVARAIPATPDTPSQDVPSHDVQAQGVPKQDVPARDVPAQNIPAQDARPKDDPSQGIPAQDIQAQGVPTQGVPAQDSPAQDVPPRDAPPQGVPAHDARAQDVPTQGVPAQDVPTPGVPTQGVPAQDVPTPGVPTQGVPAQDVPTPGVPTQGVPGRDGPGRETRDGPAALDPSTASNAPGARDVPEPVENVQPARPVEPEFEPGNRIDQELYEAALSGDSDAFLRVLLAANVLVPIPQDAPLEVTPVQREFRWEASLRGEAAVQVFTSLVRLREVLPESRFVYADFRELIGSWPREEWAMLLNPGTRIGASLRGEQVRSLSEWAVRVGLVQRRPEAPPPREPSLGEPSPQATVQDVGAPESFAAPQQAETYTESPAPQPHANAQLHANAQPYADADAYSDAQPYANARPVPQTAADLDADRVLQPTIMQKVVPHGHVGWYLEQGYDRVGGFVHPTGDVTELQTPIQLYEALGLLYEDSSFSPADEGVYVIRWPAYCPDLYRVPFGGRDEDEMATWGEAGWVIERPPFLGTGFAPGSAGSIREYKVDSVRLPYGAEMYYLGNDRSERFIAMYDPDRLAWLRPDAATGPDGWDGRTEAAQ
ncbi:SseB family protein, partial [Actinomadura rubrisoli]